MALGGNLMYYTPQKPQNYVFPTRSGQDRKVKGNLIQTMTNIKLDLGQGSNKGKGLKFKP